MKWLIMSVAVLALGCSSNEETKERETPPVLRSQIDEIVGRLGRQQGSALVADLKRLAAYGPFAVPALIEALEDSDNPRVRGSAAFVLGDIQDSRVAPALEDALEDGEPLVIYEAARSLLHQGEWSGVPVLIEGMESEDRSVRYHCHEALRTETMKDFGFGVDDAPDQRAESIDQWETWWDEFQGNS